MSEQYSNILKHITKSLKRDNANITATNIVEGKIESDNGLISTSTSSSSLLPPPAKKIILTSESIKLPDLDLPIVSKDVLKSISPRIPMRRKRNIMGDMKIIPPHLMNTIGNGAAFAEDYNKKVYGEEITETMLKDKYNNYHNADELLKNTACFDPTKPDSMEIVDENELNDEYYLERINRKEFKGLDTTKIHLRPIANRGVSEKFELEKGEIYDQSEHDAELEKFCYENLNYQQKLIYDYIEKNLGKIILIQAGPGCGKTFTLKTIAYYLAEAKFDSIIYKLDLLSAFKYNTRRFTVARFVMIMLSLRFYQYKALDKLLSSKISAYEFMLVIISMLQKAEMPNLKGGVVILDEYTIVSKPILLVTLMLLEYHQITAIICGDRNQLQNIYNSRHATLPSYRLAASFAHQQFHLDINERCSDKIYNEIIEYISQFSCNQRLDDFAFAIVAAVFLPQLIERPKYNDIHLAGTHQELATLIHFMVSQAGYPVDFYAIDKSKLRDKDNVCRAVAGLQQTQAEYDYLERRSRGDYSVEKFLPYLPLVVGARYYVYKRSEYSQGILVEICKDDKLRFQMDNGKEFLVQRSTNDQVIFEDHRTFLLNNEHGKIYSYPIYPANFMSIHMCQGCTITGNLDLILTNTRYQGLYVAMSRVTSPKQISRVVIPNQIAFLVSTIINFPEYANFQPITADVLKRVMQTYIYYQLPIEEKTLSDLASNFILATTSEQRHHYRNRLMSLVQKYEKRRVVFNDRIYEDTSNLLTMSLIIKYRDIFLSLACLHELDRNVWLHEYILSNGELSCLLPENFKANSKSYSQLMRREVNELVRLANLNYAYHMDMPTLEYIEAKASIELLIDYEDHELHKDVIIKEEASNMYLLTTKFCTKVYKKLTEMQEEARRKGEDPDEVRLPCSWLIAELDLMLETCRNTDVEESTKGNDATTDVINSNMRALEKFAKDYYAQQHLRNKRRKLETDPNHPYIDEDVIVIDDDDDNDNNVNSNINTTLVGTTSTINAIIPTTSTDLSSTLNNDTNCEILSSSTTTAATAATTAATPISSNLLRKIKEEPEDIKNIPLLNIKIEPHSNHLYETEIKIKNEKL